MWTTVANLGESHKVSMVNSLCKTLSESLPENDECMSDILPTHLGSRSSSVDLVPHRVF